MRVGLLTTYHQRCGLATYAESLADELRPLGIDVLVLAPRLGPGDALTAEEQPDRMWNRNRALATEALSVARWLERARCDVVHANVNLPLYSPQFLGTLFALLHVHRIPAVTTLHAHSGGDVRRRFLMWRLARVLRWSDVVVHNRAHADELRAAGHRRVHVIPHGMPPIDRLARPDARSAIGIAPADRVLAHFGFLMPDKGVLEVMRAVGALRQSAYPGLRYWISGAVFPSAESRQYFDVLVRERARLRLEDAVHLTGAFVSHDDASRAMTAADWVVLNYGTGGSQASSGAVTRALASGTPVAVSTAPIFDDVREAVHTIRGPLEPAIAHLLDDRELAENMRSRAAAFCASAEWSRVARRHADLYRRVVEGRRPARVQA